ncbi:MAG: type II toxin-antitoxin system VapC family toxin [bacterium]
MIVVDTNILVYLFVQGPKTGLAKRLLEHDPQWILPTLWRHEFHNVLVTHVQTKRLSQDQAERIWEKVVDLLADSEREADMAAALRMALEYKLTGYDAQFLALAEAQGVFCLSEDKALKVRAPAGRVKSLEDYFG